MAIIGMTEPDTSEQLSKWQWITLGTLLVGYVGYYICRSNLSIASPSILNEFAWDKRTLGTITSTGTLVYAFGKISNGFLADTFSSRRLFLLGMVASVACTVVLGLGSTFAVFMVAWSCNRFFQSAGWGALVKIASRWFPLQRHGFVMAVLCLSYLPGDGLARALLSGMLLYSEKTPAAESTTSPVDWADSLTPWRWMFMAAAATLSVIALASWYLLKDSPRDVGAIEPAANPQNVFGAQGVGAQEVGEEKLGFLQLVRPLLSSASFWLVLYMSLGLTLVRETFGTWTPTYLVETCGLSEYQAGMSSAIAPTLGGVAALAAGLLADRLVRRGRGLIMFVSLTLMSISLGLLARLPGGVEAWIPIALMGAAYFFLIGPYTFLTGVISLDFGGKRGAATAAGLTDAAGYLGGVLAGRWIGGIAQDRGWGPAFGVLAVAGLLTAVAAMAYWVWHDLRPRRALRSLE
jgi:OPA family glycerol-3-phosphate transporter-like MFS transporter